MNAALLSDFPKYELLIRRTISAVHNKIGGDIDEMLSMAGTLYVLACQTYKPERGAFPSHVKKVTWDDTFSMRRTELRRAKRFDKDIDILSVPEKQAGFDLQEFASSLSDEARRLLDLAFDPPENVCMTLEGIPKQKSLFAYAKRLYGWSAEQLAETAREIQSAL